jgi:hypothetical protein
VTLTLRLTAPASNHAGTGSVPRTHRPLRVRHIRRMPPHAVRAVDRVPEPVRETIAHRYAGVGRDKGRHAGWNNRAWHSSGVATPSYQEALLSCIHLVKITD